MDPQMDELSPAECSALLALGEVGRIAVVVDGEPIVVPVNYRWLPSAQASYVSVRTRPGNVVDRGAPPVAFEIDGVDPVHHAGWSVLVRGTLHHLDHLGPARELLDPHPWLAEDRDSWLVIDARLVTGRRLRPAAAEWAFHLRGYL
jgi:nitroimidazol reductase NimA-like FMN-containing flavoprotein (pyridoxamine 5'-phosphate oxidase superfamily)